MYTLLGGVIIKKLSAERKAWLIRKNLKIMKKKSNNRPFKPSESIIHKQSFNQIIHIAPKVFSFQKNPEETIDYFKLYTDEMKKRKRNMEYIFDLSEVKSVTVDAIMYILALLRNVKSNRYLGTRFKGNMPIDKKAREIVLNSGFNNYVNSSVNVYKPASKLIQILNGNNSSPDLTNQICKFMIASPKVKNIRIAPVYESLIELMTNTVQHAYDKDSIFNKQWYLYAEDIGDRFNFVFLDTGLGLPKTVSKKMIESITLKDSEYIKSALLGQDRSKTKLGYRGEGLPLLYEYAAENHFVNFRLHSGKGACSFDKDLVTYDYKQELIGTLYTWEIMKGAKVNAN